MNERRLEGRFMCADLVRMVWRAGHELRTVDAILEDISAVGACVQIDEAIPVGSPVSISSADSRFFGEISYCVYRDFGYFAGIRFSDTTRWSKGQFMPEHLTDLAALSWLTDREDI